MGWKGTPRSLPPVRGHPGPFPELPGLIVDGPNCSGDDGGFKYSCDGGLNGPISPGICGTPVDDPGGVWTPSGVRISGEPPLGGDFGVDELPGGEIRGDTLGGMAGEFGRCGNGDVDGAFPTDGVPAP